MDGAIAVGRGSIGAETALRLALDSDRATNPFLAARGRIDMVSGRTVINALIGAVVGVVLSFLPLSTLLGGIASGFLEGPDDTDGALAGALAGLLMFVPIGLLAALFVSLLGFGVGVGGLPIGGFFFLLMVLGFGVFVLLVYTVGFGALGGYLGAYFAQEYPEHHSSATETIGIRSADADRRTDGRERTKPDGSEPTRWHEDRDRDHDHDRHDLKER